MSVVARYGKTAAEKLGDGRGSVAVLADGDWTLDAVLFAAARHRG